MTPTPHAIQHRDTLLALTVIEAALGMLLKEATPGTKLYTRCQSVQKWVDACSPLVRVKRLSSGAERDLDAASQALAPHMVMEATGEELLKSWAAFYWTGFTMFIGVRNACGDIAKGKSWGWLERSGWALGHLLMEIAPGCDETGTDIFLEVA